MPVVFVHALEEVPKGFRHGFRQRIRDPADMIGLQESVRGGNRCRRNGLARRQPRALLRFGLEGREILRPAIECQCDRGAQVSSEKGFTRKP